MLFSSLYLWNSGRKEDYIGHCTTVQRNNVFPLASRCGSIGVVRCDIEKESDLSWPTHGTYDKSDQKVDNIVRMYNSVRWILRLSISLTTFLYVPDPFIRRWPSVNLIYWYIVHWKWLCYEKMLLLEWMNSYNIWL